MRIPFLVVALGLSQLTLSAQITQPVYRSEADSVTLAQLQEQLSILMTPGTRSDHHAIDSVREKLFRLRTTAVVGFRYRYEPTPNYTSLADLLNGKVKPDSVTHLSIAGYKGKRLPRGVYNCVALERLEILESGFRKLPRKLNRLKNLNSLAVYNHHSKRPLRIGRNHRLTHVVFRGENPELLPTNFKRFVRLDTLDLKRNGLTTFPKVNRNRHLKQLVLAENNLTFKDDRLRGNKSLEHLMLQRNKIEAIPRAIAAFPRLKKLILNYNELTNLGPEFGKLTQLEELGLYQNKLTRIPPAVYQLEKLRFLDLYYNQIETIDDDIAKLQHLEVLYLSSNRIFKISERIGELRNLKELYVHHNRLSYLPVSLQKLQNLEVFRMNANNLVDVPEWIVQLRNLKNLDISHNRIYKAPLVIRQLSNLELVALNENAWENEEQVIDLADELALKGVIVHLEQLD